MKVFLSARYSRRNELRRVREELQRHGITVVSRWLDTEWEKKDDSGSSAAPAEYRQRHAVEDIEDVVEADCLIAFTEPPRSNGRGGRHVEFGAALALGKRLIVVGYQENIFCHHPCVEFFLGWDDALKALIGGKRQVKTCTCRGPSFALCTPVALTDEGVALLQQYQHYIGQFVCYDCGGVASSRPEIYDHVTGETVARRLQELGVLSA